MQSRRMRSVDGIIISFIRCAMSVAILTTDYLRHKAVVSCIIAGSPLSIGYLSVKHIKLLPWILPCLMITFGAWNMLFLHSVPESTIYPDAPHTISERRPWMVFANSCFIFIFPVLFNQAIPASLSVTCHTHPDCIGVDLRIPALPYASLMAVWSTICLERNCLFHCWRQIHGYPVYTRHTSFIIL